MHRIMMKSKIHRATVTGADLNYVGSITLDRRLMELADLMEHEQVHVPRKALADHRFQRAQRRAQTGRRHVKREVHEQGSDEPGHPLSTGEIVDDQLRKTDVQHRKRGLGFAHVAIAEQNKRRAFCIIFNRFSLDSLQRLHSAGYAAGRCKSDLELGREIGSFDGQGLSMLDSEVRSHPSPALTECRLPPPLHRSH